MKFCPECGSQLPIGPAKFCPNCGKSLWGILSDTSSQSVSSSFQLNQKEDISENSLFEARIGQDDTEKQENTTIHALGIKLEELIERVLKGKGFSTKRRQKLVGISGVTHEIDVLGIQGTKVLAVECKNYDEARFVGIKEIRDFQSKLNDLPHINSALFVTNSRFSSDMKSYASKYNIELWDGDKLSKIYLSILIGRHTSSFQPVVFESALPVAISYEEVSALKVVNHHSTARISKATLFFRPYYVFEYRLDLEKTDRTGKNHRIRADGSHIVDAVDENIVRKTSQETSKGHKHAFFSKKEKHPSDYEQVLNNIEHDLIVHDLSTIKAEPQYKIEETADYSITKLDCKIPFKVAKRMILEKVIEDNTKEVDYKVKLSKDKTEERTMTIIPKHDDIWIKRSSLIYVPKWVISIESKTTSYMRKVLSASNTTLVDEIALCPKDSSVLKVWVKPRPTYALCEQCGGAFCLDHIFKVNESYYCEEHRSSNMSGSS